MAEVRTRFAPSPTGDLHIGGVRTALYSWLFARKHQGKFILRIEDTDLERSTAESAQKIIEGLRWLELNHDEGPFYQTKRFERYKEVLDQLISSGDAYYCDCSKERLEALRNVQLQNKQKPRYDGHCRELGLKKSSNGGQVVRFRNPVAGEVIFHDKVYGEICFQNSELDDLILARSDGTPTYNFTVVVDDYDMKITHVIRGDDHINNTPRQINLFQALKVEPPIYAHVPMILGSDGKRLSKRHGALSVLEYKEQGYLPEALLNALIRLGWSYGDQEIFSRQEMIDLFDLDAINKSSAAFNMEKLLWLNQHYIKSLDPYYVASRLMWFLEKEDITLENLDLLPELVKAQAERCKTLLEMFEKSLYFFKDFNEYDEKAAQKHLTSEVRPAFETILEKLDNLSPSDWSAEAIHKIILKTAEQYQLGLGKLAQPLRVAMTGNTVSPSIDVTLHLLGQTTVINRLKRAIAYIENLWGFGG